MRRERSLFWPGAVPGRELSNSRLKDPHKLTTLLLTNPERNRFVSAVLLGRLCANLSKSSEYGGTMADILALQRFKVLVQGYLAQMREAAPHMLFPALDITLEKQINALAKQLWPEHFKWRDDLNREVKLFARVNLAGGESGSVEAM